MSFLPGFVKLHRCAWCRRAPIGHQETPVASFGINKYRLCIVEVAMCEFVLVANWLVGFGR